VKQLSTSFRLRAVPAYAALAVLCLALLSRAAYASPGEKHPEAYRFMDALTDKAVATANDASLDEKARQEKLGSILKENVDYRWMAGFVAGQGLKEATAPQRERYTELYPQYLVKTYLPKFRRYAGSSSPEIYDVSKDGEKYMVRTRLPGENGQQLLVDYRIRPTDKGLRIYDVIAEGVSLIVTQRSEFSAFIQRVGMEKFIERLQAFIDSPAKEPAAM
jgi:phospholipid transport system substrate-binding protein